jgi:hypothetical protein
MGNYAKRSKLEFYWFSRVSALSINKIQNSKELYKFTLAADNDGTAILPNVTKYGIWGIISPNKQGRTLNVIGSVPRSMAVDAYGFDADFFGNASLHVRKPGSGKLQSDGYDLIAQQALQASNPTTPVYTDADNTKVAGSTSFSVMQGKAYELIVTFGYNLRNEAGVMLHADLHSSIQIKFTVK